MSYIPHTRIFYCNGILASQEDADNVSGEIRHIANVRTKSHYNDTTTSEKVSQIVTRLGLGMAMAKVSEEFAAKGSELIKSGLDDLLGLPDAKLICANKLADRIERYLRKPSRKVVLVFHSQGAHIGLLALVKLHSLKDRIKVITIGGMFDIPTDLAQRVVNFQNHVDFIATIKPLIKTMYGHQGLISEESKKIIATEGHDPLSAHYALNYVSHRDFQTVLKNFVRS